MATIPLDYKESCLVSSEELNALHKKLLPEIERVYNSRTNQYSTDYASIHLPFDTELVKTIQAVVKEKKSLNPTMLIIIGIGGSNLGTIAVLEAIRGKFYNRHHDIQVYFVDTVDSDYINDIAQ